MTPVMPQKPSFKLKEIVAGEPAGKRIARIRKARGLTQVEVAGKIGITQGLYSAYERGRLRLSAEMAAQVAAVLGVTTDEILGLKEEGSEGASIHSRRLLRRMQQIESLPKRDQQAILRTIDTFLKAARM